MSLPTEPHYLDAPSLHSALAALQIEAAQAKQQGWFFCTGHNRAEEQHDGQYFYFAGKYCKAWGDEHPDHRQAAAQERYN